jgi:hypothetical protein
LIVQVIGKGRGVPQEVLYLMISLNMRHGLYPQLLRIP